MPLAGDSTNVVVHVQNLQGSPGWHDGANILPEIVSEIVIVGGRCGQNVGYAAGWDTMYNEGGRAGRRAPGRT